MKNNVIYTLIFGLLLIFLGAFSFVQAENTAGKNVITASEISAAPIANLPALKNGEPYAAEALPEFMDDIWVPWTEEEKVIVYKDKRSNLYGVADLSGNIKLEAQCPYILDQRQRGRLQNTAGHAMYIVCADDPEGYSNAGRIDLKKNMIDRSNGGFHGSGVVQSLDVHDNLILFYVDQDIYKPKYGYMDKAHNIVIRPKYKGATSFDEGYATVLMAGKWQIIEKDGSCPFKIGAWLNVQQLKGRTFIGQTMDGKWYRFEMPVSRKTPKIAISKQYVEFRFTDFGDVEVIINPFGRRLDSYPYPDMEGMRIENCKMLYYLVPGNHAEIINTTGLKLHREPAGEEIKGLQAFPGKDITILDGPVCKDGKVWFEIDFLGHKGWAMEGVKGVYYLRKTSGNPSSADPSKPVDDICKRDKNGRITTCLKIGDSVEVVNTTALQMFQRANWAPIDNLQAFPGKIAVVTDGPQFVNGSIWWEIDFLGHRGWVMEKTGSGKFYLEKK